MKNILAFGFVALVSSFTMSSVSVASVTTDELVQAAKAAYAARDYNAAGVAKAQESADHYGELVLRATSDLEKAGYLVSQAEAIYFVGNANTEDSQKVSIHKSGIEVAEAALKVLAVDPSNLTDAEAKRISALSGDQVSLIAEALYQRGINLGQWGSANGVASSLSKWPELRGTMEFIGKIGKRDIHESGPLRTLGRGYYKIPRFLGGDMDKAEKYLEQAVSKSLAKDAAGNVQKFSVNGYNNVFYADILKEQGKTDLAKEILTAFVATDAKTLKADGVPENLKAQKEAAEFLADL